MPNLYEREGVLNHVRLDWESSLRSIGLRELAIDADDNGFMALCPFHDDSNPSFHAFELSTKPKFFCFTCSKTIHGIFDLVGEMHGIAGFAERLQRTAEMVGMSPNTPAAEPAPPPKDKKENKKTLEDLENLYAARRKNLVGSAKVLKYLHDEWGIDRESAITMGLGYQRRRGIYPARLIFPVIDRSGQLVNLRKYSKEAANQGKKVTNEQGFGSPARLMGIHLIDDMGDKPVLIVAGEKDWAVARNALGDKYVVLTSTGGESSKWNPEWTEILKGRDVVICYDADEPGRKGEERVGRALQGAAKTTKAVEWPADFCEKYPKGDFADYALLHSNTPGMISLLENAKDVSWEEPESVKDAMGLIADGAIEAEESEFGRLKWVDRCEISNSYWLHYFSVTAGKVKREVISDFVIDLHFEYVNMDVSEMEISIIGRGGVRSKAINVTADERTNLREWRRRIGETGRYTWDGDQWALNEIWRMEFERNKTPKIIVSRTCGALDGKYFMGNVAVDESGKIHLSDGKGIIWIGDKGYKSDAAHNSTGNMNSYIDGPVLDAVLDRGFSVVPKQEIIDGFCGFWNKDPKVKDNFYGEMVLGWVCASMFSDVIFRKYNCFPVLFLLGDKESGKTSWISIINKCFGFDSEGDNWGQTTQFALYKTLETLSNACYALDEFNDRTFKRKIDPETVNSIYNRQPPTKGTKTMQTTRMRVNGTLMLSGRKRPDKDDFLSRITMIPFNKNTRHSPSWEAVRDNREWLPMITMETISHGSCGLVDEVEAYKQILVENGISPRAAVNYSISMGGAVRIGAVERGSEKERAMIAWVIKELNERSLQDSEENLLGDFWDTLVLLLHKGVIEEGKTWRVRLEEGELWLYFRHVYGEITNIYFAENRERFPIKKLDLLKYLDDAGYLSSHGGVKHKTVRLDDGPRRVVCFEIDRLPEEVRHAFVQGFSIE